MSKIRQQCFKRKRFSKLRKLLPALIAKTFQPTYGSSTTTTGPPLSDTENEVNKLKERCLTICNTVRTVAYWDDIHTVQEEIRRDVTPTFSRFLNICEDYVTFKCALPTHYQNVISKDLENFVETFSSEYPEVRNLHEYIQAMCNSTSSLHFGKPNFEANLDRFKKHLSYWQERLATDKDRTFIVNTERDFFNEWNLSGRCFQVVRSRHNLVQQKAPVFLAALQFLQLTRKNCFFNTTPKFAKVLTRENCVASVSDRQSYRTICREKVFANPSQKKIEPKKCKASSMIHIFPTLRF